MTLEGIRSVVEGHACHVLGIRYGFALQWAAAERNTTSDSSRYLLSVEFVASPGCGPAHGRQMLVRISQLSDLAPLLDDALYHQLAEGLIVEGTEVTGSVPKCGQATFPSVGVRTH